MNYKLLILSLYLITHLLGGSTASAQEADWYANFHNIMDNREYDRSIGLPQSILGARLDVAAGLKLDSNNAFYAGLNYMYEYGAPILALKPSLNLYYQIERSDFRSYIGSYSRKGKIDFPKAFFGDSTNYYMPNMAGMYYELIRNNWRQNGFIDWVGRQSPTVRESFIAGASGQFKHKLFYVENYVYMLHVAGASENDTLGIRDNGIASLHAGFDFSEHTFLNTLKLDIGGIINYDRVRPADYGFYTGLMLRASAHYKRVGVDLTAYKGDGLRTSYGDQLYRNGDYLRLDLCIVPLKGKYIESVFKWSFHFTKGITSTQQQFFTNSEF